MAHNLTQKILTRHLVSGVLEAGREIAIRVDQTLTQDATGTMAYLQFEALRIPRVKTELSVSYVDHNMLQTGFENADDHRFLQSVAAKYGIFFSRAGNGICHQVHLVRFGVPGKTLLGSDSHTPTAGGLAMLGIGVGGLDVANAMGGGPYHLVMPKVVSVQLKGRLSPWVTAKDVILEVLRRLTVKGALGKILEYGGEGIKYLTVPERASIANMGAETGATSSIFPSDEATRAFLRAQGREHVWIELWPDAEAAYDEVLTVDLSALEPLVACPHSPDNVKPIKDAGAPAVDQVVVGSCTNSSYQDLMRVAAILKGKLVHQQVSLVVAPGSRQVLTMLAQNGALADLVGAGARILECACGPCIGMGQAPPSNGVSVRTVNRNFKGRSGTSDGRVYLVSPETAAAAALAGKLTDPRELGDPPIIEAPQRYHLDDRLIIAPAENPAVVEIVRGPNIKPLPVAKPLPDSLQGRVLLKVGDNISTDQIMPAGAKVLPLRSNIPALSEHAFSPIDPSFPHRAKEAGGGMVVGGENYGQGSSREHAALVPMYMGITAILAKSFARIHRDNLINFGILPLTFAEAADYDRIEPDDVLVIGRIGEALRKGAELEVRNNTRDITFKVRLQIMPWQVEIVLAGGFLNYIRGSHVSDG